MALDEEDVQAPWTAEFWVLRPSAPAAAVALVSKALELRQLFAGLFETMATTKFRVDTLERRLVTDVQSSASASGSLKRAPGGRARSEAEAAEAEAERAAAAAAAAEATKNSATILLAANDEYRRVAVKAAAARAAYVDVLGAAGRRLAEADAELEELEMQGLESKVGTMTPLPPLL